MIDLRLGDCLEVLRTIPDGSVDAVVTDPPAGIGFMGKEWDKDKGGRDNWIAWMRDIAAECLRVLKPGGHALVWAIPRTSHWTATAWEDAGFEIRDRVAHVFGSGFPKSLDVSKAIDKIGGVDTAAFKSELASAVAKSGLTRAAIDAACGFTMRFDVPYEKDPGNWGSSLPSPKKLAIIAKVLGFDAGRWSALIERVWRGRAGAAHDDDTRRAFGQHYQSTDKGEAATEAARQWQGWGTALKPAMEDWWLCRKPLIGTVAENVLAHGTGAINVDGCRVATDENPSGARRASTAPSRETGTWGNDRRSAETFSAVRPGESLGRWPSHLIHDGSDEVVGLFPADKQGSASRFFYAPKASKRDRDEGLEGFEEKRTGGMQATADGSMLTGSGNERTTARANIHPTVKPTDLMRYLCRLITPPGGTVLDPFMGSGSTGKAAVLEGFSFIGIEREAEYIDIARARIAAVESRTEQLELL